MIWLISIYLIGLPPMWWWLRKHGGMSRANVIAIALWPISLMTAAFMWLEFKALR